MSTGPKNLITDVAGIHVGNAHDAQLRSGSTVVLCAEPAVAAVAVMGGAPGTRETDLLAPDKTVQAVDAIVLSGGSAFGLDAASGAQAALRDAGRGFRVGSALIPIVPAAILFDLLNGGDKDWDNPSPYFTLGQEAVKQAGKQFTIGSAGAGYGATTATVKGGLGSASTVLDNGATIGAIVAVNALGNPLVGSTRHFRSAPFEVGDEFGALGLPHPWPSDASALRTKLSGSNAAIANTTIGIIATDATLTKGEANRLAVATHDGFALALWPAHTPLDGDCIFALSTGQKQAPDMIELCAASAAVMARAIARGIYAARRLRDDDMKVWEDLS